MVPALVVMGPTGSGKSRWSHGCIDFLRTDLKTDGVIINLDASQFYEDLSVGSAKPSDWERTHYGYRGLNLLKNLANLWDAASCAQWITQQTQQAWSEQRVPIVVGGSGLYARAYLHGLDILPSRNTKIRDFLNEIRIRYGHITLYKWLETVDAPRAKQLHRNDVVRVTRALEIFLVSGKGSLEQFSKEPQSQKSPQSQDPKFIVRIIPQKDTLKRSIQERVQAMIQAGWIDEIQSILMKYKNQGLSLEDIYGLPGFKAIGYKTIALYLAENSGPKTESSLPLLTEKLATETWQYARKQMNWNKHEIAHLDMHNGTFSPSQHGPQLRAWLNSTQMLLGLNNK